MTVTKSTGTGQKRPFAVGDAVYLKAAAFGVPGRVLRVERRKLAVLWADLGPTYITRHRPESLMEAPHAQSEQAGEVMGVSE